MMGSLFTSIVGVEKDTELYRQIDSMVFWYLSRVMRRSKDKSRHLFLTVRVRKNGYGMQGKHGMAAETFNDEYEVLLNDRFQGEHMLITLMHELIHVKQYFLKELVGSDKRNTDLWLGREVNSATVFYEDLPWERQAFANERRYYRQWKLESQR